MSFVLRYAGPILDQGLPLYVRHPVGIEKAREGPFCFRLLGWMSSGLRPPASGPASPVLVFLYVPVEDLGMQLSDPSRNYQSTPRNRNCTSTS